MPWVSPNSHRVLHNVRVDAGHAVDRVGANHTEMRHVNTFAVSFLDHRHPPETVNVPWVESCHPLQTEKGTLVTQP